MSLAELSPDGNEPAVEVSLKYSLTGDYTQLV